MRGRNRKVGLLFLVTGLVLLVLYGLVKFGNLPLSQTLLLNGEMYEFQSVTPEVGKPYSFQGVTFTYQGAPGLASPEKILSEPMRYDGRKVLIKGRISADSIQSETDSTKSLRITDTNKVMRSEMEGRTLYLRVTVQVSERPAGVYEVSVVPSEVSADALPPIEAGAPPRVDWKIEYASKTVYLQLQTGKGPVSPEYQTGNDSYYALSSDKQFGVYYGEPKNKYPGFYLLVKTTSVTPALTNWLPYISGILILLGFLIYRRNV